MPRQLRIEYPNAFYHVMAHGNGFQWIYKREEDISLFKEILKNIVMKYQVKLHAAVLMRNHYHMLIETPMANLSRCMTKFNRDFAVLLNNTTGRKGSIFKDRYKAILIEKESYYLSVLRYICQNPVRINIADRCEEYRGSYLNWLKDEEFLNYVYTDDVCSYFKSEEGWYKRLIEWVNGEKEENPFKELRNRYLLGKKEWCRVIGEKIGEKIESCIRGKKKLYELRINQEIMEEELKRYDKKDQIKIKAYIYLNS